VLKQCWNRRLPRGALILEEHPSTEVSSRPEALDEPSSLPWNTHLPQGLNGFGGLMARILLSSAEQFAHRHSFPSSTELVSGEVEIQLGSLEPQPLALGEPILIPAETEHLLRNVGTSEAVIKCGLCQPIGPRQDASS
jgi:hypothetical protein